jgi:hypothetical protein
MSMQAALRGKRFVGACEHGDGKHSGSPADPAVERD